MQSKMEGYVSHLFKKKEKKKMEGYG